MVPRCHLTLLEQDEDAEPPSHRINREMTSLHHRYVTTVDVGCPSSSYASGESERWQSFKILFHRFAELPSAVGQSTRTPEFTCNGHRWRLSIYPCGNGEQANAGSVSLFLKHCSGGYATASYKMGALDKSQGLHYAKVANDRNFGSDNKSWGWADFCNRSDILDNCLDDDGTLAVQVSIKSDSAPPFVPSNPMNGMITNMFLDEKTADVCFEVSSEDVHEDSGDELTSSPVTLHAHSFILKTCAPILASSFDSDDKEITTVSITDVEPAIFCHLLYYVYGGSVSDGEMKTHAKDIINSADKYSIVNLKLAAEVAYVESTKITIENSIDNLLYADSRNCAFLKEVVMDYLAENSLSASQQLSFADVPGYLMKDVFAAVGRKMLGTKDGSDDELSAMSVSELRRNLAEVGLDVDGSRESMIEALQAVDGDSTEDDESD